MITKKHKPGTLSLMVPGILVAATGVGAGDLATASLAGSQLGVAVLWAVVVGGFFKFVMTEGIGRWQLVTGETFIEGIAHRAGIVAGWLFLPYLFLWSFFVGSALMGACGVTLHAIVPIFEIAAEGKIFWGIVSSLVGLAMVWSGGFRLFEKVMGVCIGLMFVSVAVTAILLWPGAREVLSGLVIPTIPDRGGEGVSWTVALIGGIGGTLTILCYGYWIREKERVDAESIKICRIDLMVGYGMTILFGMAMVVIGSTIRIEGQGADLLIALADRLESPLGLPGRWMFLIGAFGAVFSSLLGVWQAVPYIFADICRVFFKGPGQVETKVSTGSLLYRTYLVALALVPMSGLFMGFKEVQKLYAVIGAAFIPLVALALLILNGRRKFVGQHRNQPLTAVLLLATVVFFVFMAWMNWLGE